MFSIIFIFFFNFLFFKIFLAVYLAFLPVFFVAQEAIASYRHEFLQRNYLIVNGHQGDF